MKPENTLESLRASFEADVDIIEIDVRLTKDKIPVLVHDMHLWRTHRLPYLVNRLNYDELIRRTSNSINPVTALDAVLEEFSGQVLLNLELKDHGSAKKILPTIKKYIKTPKDWDIFLFSSVYVKELQVIRNESKHAQLALIHWFNPLRFLQAHRQLDLSGVGFHRLHVNSFVIATAKKMNLFTYAFTVNRPKAAQRLEEMGIDGIVTDLPHSMRLFFTKKS